ncbi:hypothetical protein BIV57_13240 [Mangrovactinospora gilvigrisea]|uniref:Uncharacterized protein n=1 Tax=Mangrovactinospora gilvigrisea TaxID=1428644 RepID=A0A1J7C5X9_9ACTN|nr:hypothetical protein [Mangrovactinospora gilvigrisea]OIV36952.1 hypothetical protein BIV57_13240 [Mangrovactinospora gilvigrisea]
MNTRRYCASNRPDPIANALRWLAATSTLPALVLEDFANSGQSPLVVGTLFDVLKVPAPVGTRVLEQLQQREAAMGPLLADSDTGSVYILIPPGTAGSWQAGGSAYDRAAATTLLVPIPGTTRSGRHWLNPPDGSGELTDPDLLAEIVAALLQDAEPADPGAALPASIHPLARDTVKEA